MRPFIKMSVSILREDGGINEDGQVRDGQGYVVDSMVDASELPALVAKSNEALIPIAMPVDVGMRFATELKESGFLLYEHGWLRVPPNIPH